MYVPLAVGVFRRKYSHLKFIIRNDFPLPNDPNELMNVAGMRINAEIIERKNVHSQSKPPAVETETKIYLNNGEQILYTFKHFGHLIKALEVYANSNGHFFFLQTELIGKLINKYSSSSLNNFYIRSAAESLMKHITEPLINVEYLLFHGDHMHLNRRDNRLELFPNLRYVELVSLSSLGHEYFNYHMPHIEHVSIDIGTCREPSDYFYRGVFKKNPQIRSISLYNAGSEFVQKVNDFLSQLDTLTLSRFELTNGNIQFENVTTFIIGFGYFTTPANLRFPRLETLHADYSSRYFDDYLQFFNEHNHLRHLHLKIYETEMNDSQFEQLTANLTDLVEMKLEYANKNDQNQALSTEIVMKFLRSHDKVNQLNFMNFPKHSEAKLQERLKEGWDTRINSHGLSFQRKLNT